MSKKFYLNDIEQDIETGKLKEIIELLPTLSSKETAVKLKNFTVVHSEKVQSNKMVNIYTPKKEIKNEYVNGTFPDELKEVVQKYINEHKLSLNEIKEIAENYFQNISNKVLKIEEKNTILEEIVSTVKNPPKKALPQEKLITALKKASSELIDCIHTTSQFQFSETEKDEIFHETNVVKQAIDTTLKDL
jgi:hypothetical protein